MRTMFHDVTNVHSVTFPKKKKSTAAKVWWEIWAIQTYSDQFMYTNHAAESCTLIAFGSNLRLTSVCGTSASAVGLDRL